MTKLTREAIAALRGRELDAAVNYHLFGVKTTYDWPDAPCPFADVPCHTHPDCRGLAAMIAKARQSGWTCEMFEDLSPDGDDWLVRLTFCHGGMYSKREMGGSTLPEAFARALLLTTIPPEAS